MQDIKLLQLADFLEFEVAPLQARVGKRKFDMRVWCALRKKLHGDYVSATDPINCQTAACAVGWATVLFRNEGLRLKKNGDLSEPVFRGDRSFHAAASFFEITLHEAEFLFMPPREPFEDPTPSTPRKIAEKIRAFVADRWQQEVQQEENANNPPASV